MSGQNRSGVRCLLGLIILGLVLTGCAEVIVSNPTKRHARVRVLLPDGLGGEVFWLKRGESVTAESFVPGRYRVDVIDDTDFMIWLRAKQASILGLLQLPLLTEAQIDKLEGELLSVQFQIEELAKQGASCSGTLKQEGTVTATLSWDDSKKAWGVTCVSREGGQ